jgi:hypothetical protein
MIYLVGSISGGFAAFVWCWFLVKFIKTDKESNWSKGVLWFFIAAGIIVLTFLLGPLLSWRYSISYTFAGANALWNYVFVTNIPAFCIILVGIIVNKNYWKNYIIFGLSFIFCLGWLLPILYNLLNS